jgi:hypothetical protein
VNPESSRGTQLDCWIRGSRFARPAMTTKWTGPGFKEAAAEDEAEREAIQQALPLQ